jgi:hypothetical protein
MRSVAFYLPQFHPIPENDRWWGDGFTEWTNVRHARSRFDGHEQPHVPSELGYYDLRNPDTRAAQAELARDHSIDAFCYFHYWMHGTQLLERPFGEVLSSGEPDFPFCLCWANHDWVRNWDAATGELLMPQHYSADDDRAHARWLAQAFVDPRYFRVDGKPLFLVYWVSHLPDARRFADAVRSEAASAGAGDITLWAVESAKGAAGSDPRPLGFDGSIEFQPDWSNLRSRQHGYGGLAAYDYGGVMRRILAKPTPPWRRAPGVMPRWDNTPRRPDDGTVLIGSRPALYQEWVTAAAERSVAMNPSDPVLFVTSWNEWAEGSHLEPCERYGRAYLEAHRDGIATAATGAAPLTPSVPIGHRLRAHPVVRSVLRTRLARPFRRLWKRRVERTDRLD